MRRRVALVFGRPSNDWRLATLVVGACILLVGVIGSISHAFTTNITPDGTLPTTVNQAANVYNITGGKQVGSNLFHSFQFFNVGTKDIASFNPITGQSGIINLLSRVTGGPSAVSMIDGTVRSTFPHANLFLINPAGVVFGPNATLDIGASIGQPGSFHVSTADYLGLGSPGDPNAGVFHADPSQSSVLTSAPVTAFGFLAPNPAGITVQGSTLQVPVSLDPVTGQPTGNALSLISGNISVVTDPTTRTAGTLLAPSGQINLVSVASPGEVLFPSLQAGPNVNGVSFTGMGTLTLAGGTTVDVTDYGLSGGGGGAVRIRGGQFVMDRALIIADTRAGLDGQNPGISVEMEGAVLLKNVSEIFTEAFGKGRSGDIEITARSVQVTGGSLVATDTTGPGQAGNITVTGTDSIVITGKALGQSSSISSQALQSTGDSGSIELSGNSITVGDRGLIQTRSNTGGGTGNVIIDAADLAILGGGAIVTSSSDLGSAGRVSITAENQVVISGQFNRATPSHISNLQTNPLSVAEAGGISIDTGKLILTHNGQIESQASSPDGATVNIAARDAVTIADGSSITISGGSLRTGSLNISAPAITLDHATIKGRTFTDRDAGAISLKGDSVVLSGTSHILTSTTQSSGQAGPVVVTARDSISISAGATIESSSLQNASGAGGTVTLSAGNSLSLSGTNTGVLTVAEASGHGGSITVEGSQVELTGGAALSASSTGLGNAGAITIQAGTTFKSDHSTVTTSAQQAQGGDLTITSGQSVSLNNGSRISASSSGPGNAGNITILAGNQFLSSNSAVTTQATQASGGNISIAASDMVRLTNSQITASVFGGPTTVGGNIVIDPQFVILQNSQILAQAVQGQGGNITITTGVFLPDANSVVNASSQFGVNGTVTIQSPTSNLSSVWARLQQTYAEAAALLRLRCAARVGDTYSSFVIAGRDSLPLEPGGWLPSPFALEGMAVAPPVAQDQTAPSLAVAGVLLRGFDRDLSWLGVVKAPRRFASVLGPECGS